MKTNSLELAIQTNQRNLNTITAQLQNIAARKTKELEGEPTTVRETLETITANLESELNDYTTSNTTNHTAATSLVHRNHVFDFLEPEQRSPGIIAVAWFELEMEERRLWLAMKVASSVQNTLKTAAASALVEAVNLETAIAIATARNAN